jgi:endonuclease/exonuclease/phosphatase family metal-dependent hydrolase
VASYNIRFNNPHDNENWWGHRKEATVDLLKANDLISFGVQEAVLNQMEYLDSNLENYSYVGVGRDDGKTSGEYSAIFYRKDLKLITSGTFWLSPTPDKVSKGWDAALPRVCTYAQFEMEDGNRFWHFNTHFDHVGVEARAESAQLIVDKIKEMTGKRDAVILTGDFNVTPDTDPYANIVKYMDDDLEKSKGKLIGPIGTFSGFDVNSKLERRIDYIFSRNLEVLSYSHLDDKRDNGLWVSDHLPVVATFSLKD